MHSPQHSLHLGLSESCQFLFTRALMNSVVLKSMKGTSAQPVIHSKIPPTSPSQNSFFCCQCHCLIPEGINDPSQKMNAISDSETVFKGGYTGSLVYCYVLLYSYHPIHSPSVQVWITHGCSTAAHESNRNPGRAETHWPHKNASKKNKLMMRSASEESLRGISESTRSLLRKLCTEFTLITLPWALFIFPVHHANILHSAWPKTRGAIPHRTLLRIK